MKLTNYYSLQRLVMFVATVLVLSIAAEAKSLYTSQDIENLRKQKTEDKLKEARKKYPIEVVDYIPLKGVQSFFDYFDTDEEMIGYVKGKYAICSDTKKVFYMTPAMKAIWDGSFEKKLYLKERQAWFEHMLGKFYGFSQEYHAMASGGDILNGMKKFAASFQKEFMNSVNGRKPQCVEKEVLLFLAQKSGMARAGEFASMYDRLINMQSQRLFASRPQRPAENATDAEIEAYNEKAREFIENYKSQKSQMDEIIKNIETIYGKEVRDAVIARLREMRDNSGRR